MICNEHVSTHLVYIILSLVTDLQPSYLFLTADLLNVTVLTAYLSNSFFWNFAVICTFSDIPGKLQHFLWLFKYRLLDKTTVKSMEYFKPVKISIVKYFVWILSRQSDGCFYLTLSDDCFLIETSVASIVVMVKQSK